MPDTLVAAAIQAQTALEKIDSLQDKAILLAQLGQMQDFLFEYTTSLGQLANSVPGSVRNSLANQATVLAGISNTLMDLNDNSIKMTAAISELSSSIKIIGSTLNQIATVQQIAVSDQIANNNFQQRETEAALERNDIKPAKAPDFQSIVQTQIANSTIMNATSAFSTAINDFSSKIVTGATNYIAQTEIVTWGKATIENLLVKLKLTKAASIIANPEEVAIKASKNASNAKAASGLWTPTVLPPDL